MTGNELATTTWLRRTWILGGALLIASALVGPVARAAAMGATGSAGTALFSASLVVFAFGLRRPGSVTARRPLGTAALVVLALWGFVFPLAQQAFLTPALLENRPAMAAVLTFNYVDWIVRFALALIAVVQIARAGVVPRPWNWAPTWALAAVSATWVLDQVVGLSAQQDPAAAIPIVGLDGVARLGVTVLLGVLAIVLATRPERRPGSRTVPIYQPDRTGD